MTNPPTPTPETDAVITTMGGNAYFAPNCVPADFARKLERERDAAIKSAGFCGKHKPNGGVRNCLVCTCGLLSFTLSHISYLCGHPNEMNQSDYDLHYNEQEVVKQVQQLIQERDQLRKVADELAEQLTDLDNALDPTYKFEHRSARDVLNTYNQLPHVQERKQKK